MYVGGKFIEPTHKKYFTSTNPATGKVWAELPEGSSEDVDKAVKAAHDCFISREWKTRSPTERGRLLRKFGDAISEHAEKLASIETRDNGKLYKEMLAQLKVIPSWFEYYAGLADKVEGQVIPLEKQSVF